MRKSGHGCYHRVFYLCTARHTRRSPVFPAKLVPGPDRGAGIHPAAHPSFPSSLSPAPTGERESIPPLTRLSRESGNPYGLDVELPLDKPKMHGKTGVVAKTKGPLPLVLNFRHFALTPPATTPYTVDRQLLAPCQIYQTATEAMAHNGSQRP